MILEVSPSHNSTNDKEKILTAVVYEDAKENLSNREISKTIIDHMIWNVLTSIIINKKTPGSKNQKKVLMRPYIPIIRGTLEYREMNKYINIYKDAYELLNILYQAFLFYTDPGSDQTNKNTGSHNPRIGAAGLVFEGIKRLYSVINANSETDHNYYSDVIKYINNLAMVLETIKGYRKYDNEIKSCINQIKTAKFEPEPKCPFIAMIEKLRNSDYNRILILYYPQIVHPIPQIFRSYGNVVPKRMQNIFDTLASLAKYLNRELNSGKDLDIKHIIFLVRWKKLLADHYKDYDSYLRSSLSKKGIKNYEVCTEEHKCIFDEPLQSRKTAIILLYLQDYNKYLILNHISRILGSKEDIGTIYSVIIPENAFKVNEENIKKAGSGSRLMSIISLFERSNTLLPKPLHKDFCRNIYVEAIK